MSLTRYLAGDFLDYPNQKDTKQMKRYKDIPAEKVIETICQTFYNLNNDWLYVCDVGEWEITFVSSDGKKESYDGSLMASDDLHNLSEEIRKILDMNDLWLFDGEVFEGGECSTVL